MLQREKRKLPGPCAASCDISVSHRRSFLGEISFRRCVVQACLMCTQDDLGLGESVKCVLGWVHRLLGKHQELGSLTGSLLNSQGTWFTEAGHKCGGIHRAGEGRGCGCRAQTVLLCLPLSITQLIHPRVSASVRAQHLPPPCEVLFMSERSGCKKVGWHQPACGWMSLEMSLPEGTAVLQGGHIFQSLIMLSPPHFFHLLGCF